MSEPNWLRVKNYLEEHKRMTTMDGYDKLRITRLSQYVMILRKKGLDIETVMHERRDLDGKRHLWGEYILHQ